MIRSGSRNLLLLYWTFVKSVEHFTRWTENESSVLNQNLRWDGTGPTTTSSRLLQDKVAPAAPVCGTRVLVAPTVPVQSGGQAGAPAQRRFPERDASAVPSAVPSGSVGQQEAFYRANVVLHCGREGTSVPVRLSCRAVEPAHVPVHVRDPADESERTKRSGVFISIH